MKWNINLEVILNIFIKGQNLIIINIYAICI